MNNGRQNKDFLSYRKIPLLDKGIFHRKPDLTYYQQMNIRYTDPLNCLKINIFYHFFYFCCNSDMNNGNFGKLRRNYPKICLNMNNYRTNECLFYYPFPLSKLNNLRWCQRRKFCKNNYKHHKLINYLYQKIHLNTCICLHLTLNSFYRMWNIQYINQQDLKII